MKSANNFIYCFQRLIYKAVASRPASWLGARTFHLIDPLVYRLSGSRFTLVSLLGGLPVLILTTTGAKSGQKRDVPLIGIPDEDRIILIASNFGKTYHPAWYHNLRANPEVEVTVGRNKSTYIARVAMDEEYDAYWEKALSYYEGYDAYKRRTGGRKIPIVVLTPFDEDSAV
jgi:deazaflavin-dependent oxidoreductase (nitroreductase family)